MVTGRRSPSETMSSRRPDAEMGMRPGPASLHVWLTSHFAFTLALSGTLLAGGPRARQQNERRAGHRGDAPRRSWFAAGGGTTPGGVRGLERAAPRSGNPRGQSHRALQGGQRAGDPASILWSVLGGPHRTDAPRRSSRLAASCSPAVSIFSRIPTSAIEGRLSPSKLEASLTRLEGEARCASSNRHQGGRAARSAGPR